MIRTLTTGLCLLLLLAFSSSALAFGMGGCGEGKCSDCHSLDSKEAGKLLGDSVDKVLKVQFAEMPGVWLVEVEKGGQKFPLYLDFSKKYVVAGNIYRLADKTNITTEAQAVHHVDPTKIPTEDAVLLGNPMAEKRVIVFTDPLCPYCSRLHQELEKAVKQDPNIAFLIKLNPLDMHGKAAYDLAKAVVCSKSIDTLAKGFQLVPLNNQLLQTKRLPGVNPKQVAELQQQLDAKVAQITKGGCDTPAVDATKALTKELGIRSTPTLVLPDGTVKPGVRSAAELIQMIDPAAVAKQPKG